MAEAKHDAEIEPFAPDQLNGCVGNVLPLQTPFPIRHMSIDY